MGLFTWFQTWVKKDLHLHSFTCKEELDGWSSLRVSDRRTVDIYLPVIGENL